MLFLFRCARILDGFECKVAAKNNYHNGKKSQNYRGIILNVLHNAKNNHKNKKKSHPLLKGDNGFFASRERKTSKIIPR